MKERPTSPHISIHKWNIASLCSITNRLTGLFLSFVTSSLLLVFSIAVTFSPDGFSKVDELFNKIEKFINCGCIFSKLITIGFLFAFLFSLFFHSLNGLRYLMWSFCVMMKLKQINISGYLIFLSAFLLSAFSVFVILF